VTAVLDRLQDARVMAAPGRQPGATVTVELVHPPIAKATAVLDHLLGATVTAEPVHLLVQQ
jgi:hypothetical protein